jgi:predicted  nucleic acid-binding Zn-ribbon protein
MLKTLPRLLALQTCDQLIRETVQTLESLQSSLAALEDQARASVRERQGCHDRIRDARQVREVLVAQRTQIKHQLREKKRGEHHRGPGKVKEFLQGEIALLDAQKAAIEEELRIVEEQIANDSATLHQVEEGALTQAEERQRTTAALCEQIATTQAILRAAQEERTVLTPGLPPFVVSEYERIFAHRSGIAVVAIAHEICQGCHLHVPAHFCLELQKTPRLAFCPNCHRVVFVATEAPVVSLSSHPPATIDRRAPLQQLRARMTAPNRKTLASTRQPHCVPTHL